MSTMSGWVRGAGAFTLGLALATMGCGAGPQPGVTVEVRADASVELVRPEVTPSRARVGPRGGRVGTEDGVCRAIVPPGALAAETWVSFEVTPDGEAWALTWLGEPIALPILVQCQPPAGARPFELRLERVGLGVSARERLPTPALETDGWLTTWTWQEGVLRWVRSSCSPRGPLGHLTCLADPRERCLRAPDPPLSTACAFGCTADAECPAGLGCHRGRCEPMPCEGADTCRAGESCAGAEGLRFCLPRDPPRACDACAPGEACVQTSSAADGERRCGPPTVGCLGTARACSLVTYDAFEGLDRSAGGVEDPAWQLGARLTDPQGTVVPFTQPASLPLDCAPSFGGVGRFVLWEDARFAGALFTLNDCQTTQFQEFHLPRWAQPGYSLLVVPPPRDFLPRVGSAGESVVSWRAPQAGRVRVDLGLTPSAYEVESSRFMSARVDHLTAGGRRPVIGAGRFFAEDGSRELRVDVVLEVDARDTVELSFESRSGARITRSPTYVNWQVTYLEVSR